MNILNVLEVLNTNLDGIGFKLKCIGIVLLIVSIVIFSVAILNIEKISKKWLNDTYTKDKKGEENV